MFNPRYHDTDRLMEELARAMVNYQALNEVAG
jgi:MoxR-like ATPase